jgi:hypothetical protein
MRMINDAFGRVWEKGLVTDFKNVFTYNGLRETEKASVFVTKLSQNNEVRVE